MVFVGFIYMLESQNTLCQRFSSSFWSCFLFRVHVFKSLPASEPVSGVTAMLVPSFAHVLIILSPLFCFLITVFETAIQFCQRLFSRCFAFFLLDLSRLSSKCPWGWPCGVTWFPPEMGTTPAPYQSFSSCSPIYIRSCSHLTSKINGPVTHLFSVSSVRDLTTATAPRWHNPRCPGGDLRWPMMEGRKPHRDPGHIMPHSTDF